MNPPRRITKPKPLRLVCEHGHEVWGVPGTPAPAVCPYVVHGRPCPGVLGDLSNPQQVLGAHTSRPVVDVAVGEAL